MWCASFLLPLRRLIKTNMEEEEKLDKWYVGLTIDQKEHIGSKLAGRQTPYPKCTREWSALSLEMKQSVRDHCLKSHNFMHRIWTEGNSMSY